MTELTILEVIKRLEKNKWYHVPEDYLLSNYVYLEYSDAGHKLIDLFNYWSKQFIFYRFEISRPFEMPVWDDLLQEMKIISVRKITLVKKKI